jgi:hypothetical protein
MFMEWSSKLKELTKESYKIKEFIKLAKKRKFLQKKV